MSVQAVTRAFVQQFYISLNETPASNARFFSKDASVVISDEANDNEAQEYATPEAIAQYFTDNYTVGSTAMEASFWKGTAVNDGHILIHLIGTFSTDGVHARKMAQTFYLVNAADPKSKKIRYICSQFTNIFLADAVPQQVEEEEVPVVQDAVVTAAPVEEVVTPAVVASSDAPTIETQQQQREEAAPTEAVAEVSQQQQQPPVVHEASSVQQQQTDVTVDVVEAPTATQQEEPKKKEEATFSSWASMARANKNATANANPIGKIPDQVVIPRAKQPAKGKSAQGARRAGNNNSGNANNNGAKSNKGSNSRGSSNNNNNKKEKTSSGNGDNASTNAKGNAGNNRTSGSGKRGARGGQPPVNRHPIEQILFVKDLPANTNKEHLEEVFGGFGTIIDVDAFKAGGRNYANVTFDSADAVNNCLAAEGAFSVNGGEVSVDRRKPQRPRDNRNRRPQNSGNNSNNKQ